MSVSGCGRLLPNWLDSVQGSCTFHNASLSHSSSQIIFLRSFLLGYVQNLRNAYLVCPFLWKYVGWSFFKVHFPFSVNPLSWFPYSHFLMSQTQVHQTSFNKLRAHTPPPARVYIPPHETNRWNVKGMWQCAHNLLCTQAQKKKTFACEIFVVPGTKKVLNAKINYDFHNAPHIFLINW